MYGLWVDYSVWCRFILGKKYSCEVKLLSHVRLFATPWTVAYQAPLSMEFSRQEHWSGLPFPSPGDLPHPGIEPGSPALQADALPSEPPGKPIKDDNCQYKDTPLIHVTCKNFKNILLLKKKNSAKLIQLCKV